MLSTLNTKVVCPCLSFVNPELLGRCRAMQVRPTGSTEVTLMIYCYTGSWASLNSLVVSLSYQNSNLGKTGLLS